MSISIKNYLIAQDTVRLESVPLQKNERKRERI